MTSDLIISFEIIIFKFLYSLYYICLTPFCIQTRLSFYSLQRPRFLFSSWIIVSTLEYSTSMPQDLSIPYRMNVYSRSHVLDPKISTKVLSLTQKPRVDEIHTTTWTLLTYFDSRPCRRRSFFPYNFLKETVVEMGPFTILRHLLLLLFVFRLGTWSRKNGLRFIPLVVLFFLIQFFIGTRTLCEPRGQCLFTCW